VGACRSPIEVRPDRATRDTESGMSVGILLQKRRIRQLCGISALRWIETETEGRLPGRLVRPKSALIYSIALRNSSPNRRISPALSCLRTRATIGGVSLGTMLDEAGEGAGMVKWTT
jgi:hypothetical protein